NQNRWHKMNDPSKEYQKLIEENALLKQRIQKLEKSVESGKTGKLTEQADRKFEAICQCSPDVITITDLTSGLLLDVNNSCLKLVGYSREEGIGSSTKELNIWDNMEEKDRIFDRIKPHAAVDKVELTFRTKNGQSRQMLFSARRIEVAGRQLLIADPHDITDRKKAEE